MAVIKSATDYRGKTIKYNSKSKMKFILDYIMDPKKTQDEWKGGVFLNNPNRAYEEFMAVKELHQSTGKRMCIHLIQSFAPGESNVWEVRTIAEEMLQHPKFAGFQVAYAVHADKDYLHTHFVINTVNVETGKKWQMSKDELQELKDYSDQLCKGHGLSVIKKTSNQTWISQSQVDAEKQGVGWKKEMKLAIDDTLKVAVSKADFIYLMKQQGYDVRWDDKHTYILFTNMEGKSMRNRLLVPKEHYTKDAMELRIKQNQKEKLPPGKEKGSMRTETFFAVRDAKKVATSKAEFIYLMKQQGYDVKWDDKHTYITFTKEGSKPIRNRSFYPKEDYTKDALLHQFDKNKEKLQLYKTGDYKQQLGTMEQKRGDFIFLISSIFRTKPGDFYPRQTRLKNDSMQALDEWKKEMEKGKGLDWEQ